jgi:hypothetical protein
MDASTIWSLVHYTVGGSLLVAGAVLLKPILSPTIIGYPWEEGSDKQNKTVILAGSYNPPHLGHLAMLEYLSKRYVRNPVFRGKQAGTYFPLLTESLPMLLLI